MFFFKTDLISINVRSSCIHVDAVPSLIVYEKEKFDVNLVRMMRKAKRNKSEIINAALQTLKHVILVFSKEKEFCNSDSSMNFKNVYGYIYRETFHLPAI